VADLIAELRALLADERCLCSSAHTDWHGVADLLDEIERLRRWKAEAMPLFDGMQDLGRALDLPLGTLVTGPRAIEAAEVLRAERDAARDEVARLRGADQ
jgi:hypothetical protein